MSRTYTTKAIILQGKNHGEADRIVTAFTKERGKVDFYARGVRKIQGKNRALVQPFTYSELELVERKGLDLLTQGLLIESFSRIQGDFQRIITATYLAEYLIQVLPSRDPVPELCHEFLRALNHMDKRPAPPDLVGLVFLIRSFVWLGYQPALDACCACHRPVGTVDGGRYIPDEGFVCLACQTGRGIPMDRALLDYYASLEAADLRGLSARLEDPLLMERAACFVENLLFFILEREHRSASFLQKIRRMQL